MSDEIFYDFVVELNLKLDAERRQVMQEMSVEREHHQRLVKEHGRLQQRMENLLEERNSKSTPNSPPTLVDNVMSSRLYDDDRLYNNCDSNYVIRSRNASDADSIYKQQRYYDFAQLGDGNKGFDRDWLKSRCSQRKRHSGALKEENYFSPTCTALQPRDEFQYHVMPYSRQRNPILYLIMSALGRVMSSSSVYWLMAMLNPQTTSPARMELDFGMRFRFNM